MFKIARSEWKSGQKNKLVEQFLARPSIDPDAEKVAFEVLADIRKRGDERSRLRGEV